VGRLKTSLPDKLAASVKATMAEWQAAGRVKRLWQKDASLWTGSDEANWLGWLDIVDDQIAYRDRLRKVAEDVQSSGFQRVLLLGMGGSSLCPEVLRMTFGKIPDFPELHVLDSTDPAIRRDRRTRADRIQESSSR
jgi:transaldolase/glucose-6-phosphate isomerase